MIVFTSDVQVALSKVSSAGGTPQPLTTLDKQTDEATQRFGCNRISTITNRETLRFMVFQKRFTQPVLLAFLRRLLHSVKGKVLLILDGHPVHHGKRVQHWLATQQGRITLFFLPGYSPELNPDELLNQDVKSHAGRQRPKDKAHMIQSLRARLRSTQKQPAKVRRYFHQEHVAYAAA